MKYSKAIAVLVVIMGFMSGISYAQYDEECHYECATTYCDLFDYYCDYDCYEVCYPYRYANAMRSKSDSALKTANKASEGARRPTKSSATAPEQQSTTSSMFSNASIKARTGKVVKMRIQNPSVHQTTRSKVSSSNRSHAHHANKIALFQSCLSNSKQESGASKNS